MITKYQLVPLTEEYLSLILEWRNHPDVRNNMYTSHIISTEEHYAWFNALLGDLTKKYFVFLLEGQAQGLIGFTKINNDEKRVEWAFYANPQAKRGVGSSMEFFARVCF